jgi:hypothetical protein
MNRALTRILLGGPAALVCLSIRPAASGRYQVVDRTFSQFASYDGQGSMMVCIRGLLDKMLAEKYERVGWRIQGSPRVVLPFTT